MKKKAASLFYVGIVLALCLLPLLGMGFASVEQTTENRDLAEWPKLVTKGGLNTGYLEGIGTWFTDRFAFRQELVTADARLRGSVFGVSAEDDVIFGRNGWLYYEATLDDYQHKNPVSERMLFNMAHNTALMQEYTESLGRTFVFTIAPNKNTLYGDNMPARYKHTVEAQSDMERLVPWLEREKVNYVDLYALFAGRDDVLYYARDSHWNQEGALMVYNALLDACGKAHETWADREAEPVSDYLGDLNLMLYPLGAEPEPDLSYQKYFTWSYSQGDDVEDDFIRTVCPSGSQNLLMYRDSFGNSLLPYMAEAFSQATFSKQVPYPMTDLINSSPDIVIVEKVERHLPTLGSVPPLMSGLRRTLSEEPVPAESDTAVRLTKEGSYWKLTGVADEKYLDTDSRIFVEVGDGANSGVYEAFCVDAAVNGRSSDYGFILYLSEIMLDGSSFDVRVIAEGNTQPMVLYEGKLEYGGTGK